MAQSNDDVLNTWNLGLLVYDKRDLIKVSSTSTVEEALFLLQKENILAVVVVDDENQNNMKILTIFDVMTYVAFGSFKYGDEEPDAFSVFRSANIPVSSLLNAPIHPEDEKLWTFKSTDPISKVLEPMSKGVHRVLVDLNTEGDKPNYRMLTQSDLLRFLASYNLFEKHPQLNAQETVKNLNVMSKLQKSVNENTKALEVFRILHLDDISAVPLVNDAGQLTSTLSASDLRGLRSYQLKSVLLPAIDFLHIYKGPAARRCITCTENDSLSNVINKLIVHRIHRVWVVDANSTPVGCISLSDIIGKYVVY